MQCIFKICPNCGSKNHTFKNTVRFHCDDCDFVYYHNIAAAVAVIIRYEDEVLFTVRNQEPDKGRWDLPGGFIDPNETAEEAACREIKEELGLQVHPKDLKYLTTQPNHYLYRNISYRTMDIFYELSIAKKIDEITAKDEIQQLIWVPQTAIELDKIGFISVRKVIQECIKK